MKNKFPLPIIEELFEELHGAQWFTTLDLRSGFHQVMVNPDDQYKIAFQTHHGHYEYKGDAIWLNRSTCYFSICYESCVSTLAQKVCSCLH
jgi:hypothetical protein